jgi:hypothetical protein
LPSASAKSSISTFLQLLQFGISVLSLQLFWYLFFSSVSAIWYLRSVSAKKNNNLVWYFIFRFCKIWYFDFPSASAILYLCSVSAIVLVFHFLFSFCNLIFELSFWKKNLEWYFVFRFCKIWYFDFPLASVMASTTKEIVWLRWLFADMRVFFSHPTPMYYDNQSSIQIAHNSVFHEWTKHIKIDCHLTRHHLKHDTITLSFVHFSLQIADFFTKTHSISRFHFLVGKLSILVTAASWVWGEMLSNIYLVLFIKGRIIFSV